MEEDKILFVWFKENCFGFEFEIDQLFQDVNDWSGVLLILFSKRLIWLNQVACDKRMKSE
jgi:hypothetical protein